MVHTRTNFGKTRGYVPPMVPSSPPGRMLADPSSIPSPNRVTNPFEDGFEEEDAPDDEANFRTIRSLRPKPGQYHSDGSNKVSRGRLHRRHNSATQDVTGPPSPHRPDAYISETDESSMGYHDLPYKTRPQRSPSPSRDTRQPYPEEPFDMAPTRSQGKEARHLSPIENIDTSPIRPSSKEQDAPGSPRQRSAEELAEIRRRRRRIKSKQAAQQFEMPTTVAEPHPPPMRNTSNSTKTSDLTDDTELDPMPSFDNMSGVQGVMESEMEYHENGDVSPPPPESSCYEEFETGREASLSPQKKALMPKSILRSKRTMSPQESFNDGDDDDDSLFDFAKSTTDSALGETIVRKSSLKSGTNSSNRKGRRSRRRSEEEGNDDDESLIQYGEHRKRSSSLQERTQEAWTFRSKRSFSATPKKESAGVQFGNTDTIHHFDDQETVGTAGTCHSLNSFYTKSPESEAEDLIKDLLMIGSGEHSNPGRRKLKFQPVYKRQLKKEGDYPDDNTLGTTDISLNTLDYTSVTGGTLTAYSKATPNTEVTDDVSLVKLPNQNDTLSRTACKTLDSRSSANSDGDPLAFFWHYVSSGMAALGLSTSEEPKEVDEMQEPQTENELTVEPTVEPTAREMPPTEDAITEDMTAARAPGVWVETEFSEIEGIVTSATSGTVDDYPADEVKEDGKGSFGDVMDYIFGDPTQKDEVRDPWKACFAIVFVCEALSNGLYYACFDRARTNGRTPHLQGQSLPPVQHWKTIRDSRNWHCML